MTNHGSISERSRLALLTVTVGALITAAVVAIVIVTTGSESGSADTASRADRRQQTSAAPETRTPTSAASSTTPKSSTSPVGKTSRLPKAAKVIQPKKPKKPITYTVKKGDNLYVIAAWFKLHGYGKLYERNKDVIGKNPALILPGQKITVSGRGMTVSGG